MATKNLIISPLGILIKKSYFNNQQLETLKKMLTIEYTKYLGKRMTIYRSLLYRDVSDEWLGVARFSNVKKILMNIFGSEYPLQYVNKLMPGDDIVINDSKLILRDHQEHAVNHLLATVYTPARIKSGSASCVFIMETGLGKTYVSLGILNTIRKKTLILIPNSAGLADWITAITNSFPDLKLGQYNSKTKTDGDIVIMIMNSALKESFKFRAGCFIDKSIVTGEISRYKYFKQFGFVIMDEIHCSVSDGFQEVFWHINFSCALGITATPGERQDKMDVVYEKHFGNLIHANKLAGFGISPINWRGVVKVIRYHGPKSHTGRIMGAAGMTDMVETNKMLADDIYRNQVLLDQCWELHKKGMYAFIFAEYLGLLKKLMDVLNLQGLPHIDDVGDDKNDIAIMKYTGGSTPTDKRNAELIAQLIFTTYGFSSKSVSIVKCNAEIFATPRRNNMRQILGRATRIGGDPSIVRVFVDLVDVETPAMDQFKDRKRIYLEKGYQIEKHIVDYQNVKISPELRLVDAGKDASLQPQKCIFANREVDTESRLKK